MRYCIHRAASQVGGNCIELQAAGQSILLDLGLPLGSERASADLLPDIPGLAGGERGNLLAVVLSHPHQDHYGLLQSATPDIPVYLGSGAARLLEAAAFFTFSAHISQRTITYEAFRPFQIGPFSITPFPVDHSAYDAYALLVEADGKRLLYSGDFRLHGRKHRLMESMLDNPPQKVDVLLMEGTVVGREDAERRVTESDLELGITASLKRCKGLALACFSPQNVDRLVTFFRAALRARRTLVVDVYTAHILDAIGIRSLPSARRSEGVRVFLPRRQKLQIVRSKRFDLLEPFQATRVFPSHIRANPGRWLCLFRSSMFSDFEALGCLKGAVLMYSLWPGYLRKDSEGLRPWAARNGVSIELHHTSGHAFTPDLIRFVESIAPRTLVPIHTSRPEMFPAIFKRVTIVPDGTWTDV